MQRRRHRHIRHIASVVLGNPAANLPTRFWKYRTTASAACCKSSVLENQSIVPGHLRNVGEGRSVLAVVGTAPVVPNVIERSAADSRYIRKTGRSIYGWSEASSLSSVNCTIAIGCAGVSRCRRDRDALSVGLLCDKAQHVHSGRGEIRFAIAVADADDRGQI